MQRVLVMARLLLLMILMMMVMRLRMTNQKVAKVK